MPEDEKKKTEAGPGGKDRAGQGSGPGGGRETGGDDEKSRSGAGTDTGSGANDDKSGSDTGSGSTDQSKSGEKKSSSDTGGSADDSQQSGQGKKGQTGDDGDPTKNKLGKYDTGGSADDQKQGGGKKKKNKSFGQKLKSAAMKAQMAMHMAATAMKALLAMKLMMFLQMMMQAVAALVSAAVAAISAVVTAVVTAVATAIGVSVAVAAFGIFGVLAVAVVAVVVVVVTEIDSTNTQTRDSMPDCNTDISYMNDENIEASVMSHAQLVYSFFKAMNYSDAQIAGILGCWVAESGIDPTSVETCFGSRYGIDQRKAWFENGKVQVVWHYSGTPRRHTSTEFILTGDIILYWDFVGRDPDTNEPIYEPARRTVSNRSNTVWSRSFNVSPGTYTINFESKFLAPFNVAYAGGENYFVHFPAIQQVGIGLGQWTNGRTQMLLDYASEHGRKWYEIETQLLFMCTKDDATRVNWLLNSWIDDEHQLYSNTENGARDACRRFAVFWEGCPNTDEFIIPRQNAAAEWFKIISNWTAGVDYNAAAGQSLWEIVKAENSGSYDAVQSTALRDCSGARFQDSHNAAAAIVSYAWGPGQPYENDGTQCWQHIHSVVAPGDAWKRACDRTVACAIRWSGTDTGYPLGACRHQLDYLTASDAAYRLALHDGNRATLSNNQAYWMDVTPTWNGNASEYIAQLKPGDVLIRADDAANVHHTLMYVGYETIQRRWPDAPSHLCCVSGSVPFTGCTGYSPHVGGFSTASSGSGAYQLYRVFRCMKTYSNNSEWTNATCASYSNDT